MRESKLPLIKHIPHFLNYCKDEKNLSDYTFQNYQMYLNKFIVWLKKNKKQDILPHQLTNNDILEYKAFLATPDKNTGKTLKKITQNYYLVALRALLSYFSAKDIICASSQAKSSSQGALNAKERLRTLPLIK